MTIPRINILGVEVSAVNMQQTLATFDEWLARGTRQYVCVTPAHAIMDCYGDPELLSIFNASGLTVPDGMAIVWLLRLYHQKGVTRVYGPDLMKNVCELSVKKGWRHFLYGGEPGVADCLKSELEKRYPGIRVVGTFPPPFRALTAEENHGVVASINSLSPDIVWVGISSPKQERWMHAQREALNAGILVGVGAAFDFLTRRKAQAPRWIQGMGFEWLFRLLSEPRRLWPRYSRYPKFAMLALAQLLGLRSFTEGQ